MNVETFIKTPRVWDMKLKAKPMTVWLTRNAKVTIEPGDRLKVVAACIEGYLELGEEESAKLAAFYFEMGERAATKRFSDPWPDDIDTSPRRLYGGPRSR